MSDNMLEWVQQAVAILSEVYTKLDAGEEVTEYDMDVMQEVLRAATPFMEYMSK